MARIVFTFVTFVFAMTLGATLASADIGLGNGNAFAWFRDADGDGIPNGMDDDWFPPENGDGYQLKNHFGLFGMGAFLGGREDANAYRNQNRYRKDKPDAPGDYLRIRLRLGDGSCK